MYAAKTPHDGRNLYVFLLKRIPLSLYHFLSVPARVNVYKIYNTLSPGYLRFTANLAMRVRSAIKIYSDEAKKLLATSSPNLDPRNLRPSCLTSDTIQASKQIRFIVESYLNFLIFKCSLYFFNGKWILTHLLQNKVDGTPTRSTKAFIIYARSSNLQYMPACLHTELFYIRSPRARCCVSRNSSTCGHTVLLSTACKSCNIPWALIGSTLI
jgi:hypothetical protein